MPSRVRLCARIKESLPPNYSTKLLRGSDRSVPDAIEIFRDGHSTRTVIEIDDGYYVVRGPSGDSLGRFNSGSEDQMIGQISRSFNLRRESERAAD